MRLRGAALVACFAAILGLAWGACGNASSGGTGAGGSTNCTGGPFEVTCEECIEASCCAQAAHCYNDPTCAACIEPTPPDAGACIDGATPTLDALNACATKSCAGPCLPSSTCNPVTNQGCVSPDACDLDQQGVFVCFPGTTEAALCAACSGENGPPCEPTLHCLETGGAGSCARYCCGDGDCGGGVCDTSSLPGGVGLCVKTLAGGIDPVCTAPTQAPSGGSCFTVPDAG